MNQVLPPLFAASPMRMQPSSSPSEDALKPKTKSPPKHDSGKLWWSPSELKVLLDDDAEEIHQLHQAVDALLTENTQLRLEIAVLKTPSHVYETVFSPKQQRSLSSSSESLVVATLEEPATTAAQKASDLLAVLRCGARIRATEASIVNTGADAALYRHQCTALAAQLSNAQDDAHQLRAQLKTVQSVLTEQDTAIKEWAARCDAKDGLLRNERDARAAAQQIADGLQALVQELRQALTTERERCMLLETDATMLRERNDELQVLERHQMNVALVHQALQQELRAIKARCDHARIRVVQLEMEMERAGVPFPPHGDGGRGEGRVVCGDGDGMVGASPSPSRPKDKQSDEEVFDGDRLAHLL